MRARRQVIVVAAVVVAIDQVTKWWVLRGIGVGEEVHIVGSLVLRRTFNSGVAFSFGSRRGALPYVLPVVVVAVLVWAWRGAVRVPFVTSRLAPMGLGLIVGGAVGNQLDRTFRGHHILRGAVVDFVDPGFFAVFNAADTALTIGCLALAWFVWRRDHEPAVTE